MFRTTTFNLGPSEYPGTVEFIPLPNAQEQFAGKVYQVKSSGTSGILGEIWDINPQRSHFSIDNEEILSEEEISRADQIIGDEARNHFIARHVIVRTILSRYLLIPPEKICFSYNPWGRPSVVGNRESGRIFFNISNTEGRVLIAVSRNFQPGIDYETVNSAPDIMGIARTYFHSDLVDYLASLRLPERRYQFFRIWVHTEACMKAIGTGLVHSSRSLLFPRGLPIPPKYIIRAPEYSYPGVFMGMDIPSKNSTVTACVFHLPNGLS